MDTARPLAGTKKNKETTENTEHAEKQIDFFREFRAFRSCQELIVVEQLSGDVCQLSAVSSTGFTEVFELRSNRAFHLTTNVPNLRELAGAEFG